MEFNQYYISTVLDNIFKWVPGVSLVFNNYIKINETDGDGEWINRVDL